MSSPPLSRPSSSEMKKGRHTVNSLIKLQVWFISDHHLHSVSKKHYLWDEFRSLETTVINTQKSTHVQSDKKSKAVF